MISFEEVMRVTSGVSGNAAFEDVECRAYYDLISSLPSGSNIVEIGLQYGRSSSIALQVAASLGHKYWGVDPWESPEVHAAWIGMVSLCAHGTWLNLLSMKAQDVPAENWPASIHLALIDGDHEAAGVRADCAIIMPRIASGGYLCAHDYGRDSLPEVYVTMNECIAGQPFVHVGIFGTLGVWKRV